MFLVANNKYAFIILLIVTGITFLIRISTFLLFRNKEMPKSIKYIANILPLAIMPTLVIYCIRETAWTDYRSVIPTFVAITITALVHLWKKNFILSLIIGTATFMILIRVLA